MGPTLLRFFWWSNTSSGEYEKSKPDLVLFEKNLRADIEKEGLRCKRDYLDHIKTKGSAPYPFVCSFLVPTSGKYTDPKNVEKESIVQSVVSGLSDVKSEHSYECYPDDRGGVEYQFEGWDIKLEF